jgi:hypothetical protein
VSLGVEEDFRVMDLAGWVIEKGEDGTDLGEGGLGW